MVTEVFPAFDSDSTSRRKSPLVEESSILPWEDKRAWNQLLDFKDQDPDSAKPRVNAVEALQDPMIRLRSGVLGDEEILGWWQGRIVSVREKDKVFETELIDLDGKDSIAEIEFGSAGDSQQGDIRVGARFVFSVVRVDGPGGVETKSHLQFLPAYRWSKKDAANIEKRLNELFEDNEKTSCESAY